MKEITKYRQRIDLLTILLCNRKLPKAVYSVYQLNSKQCNIMLQQVVR